LKVIAIIQARMGSMRLPGKVLMSINGKPVLEYVIQFLKFSKLLDQIIVATTNLPQDNEIEKLCKKLNIECYRGSVDNVLERYYECARLYHGDLIVRITADDPLIDATIVDQVIQICKDTKCDFASTAITPKFPFGYFIESLTFSTLKKLYLTQNDPLSKEHVTYFIKQNIQLFNVKEISPSEKLARPQYRLTIDYKEDFHLMSKIFKKLYTPNSFIQYKDVIELLDKNPELAKINKNI